jgi:hypothetical protein
MGFSEAELRQLEENQRRANPTDSNSGKHQPFEYDPSPKSEAELERICTQVLEMDGWRSLKTNPVSRRARGAGFGELGMADYLYIRYPDPRLPMGTQKCMKMGHLGPCDVMWIEWKRQGGLPEEHQIKWIVAERNRGALVLLAGQDFPATVDGFCAWYESSGLKRAHWADIAPPKEERK